MGENKQRIFGLIGKTLKHSFSADYFANKFETEEIKNTIYRLFELETIEAFESLKKTENLSGLNVTIPYKKEIIPFLDEMDEVAAKIQAVNTIKFVDDTCIGFNTDVIGFEESIKKLIGRKRVKTALVLGTGGASEAIKFCLARLGIEYKMVSRSKGDYNYEELNKEIMAHHRLIVNCTPLGTYPDMHLAPNIPYNRLTKKHLLFDLVYNPEKTLFLERGEQKNCSIRNGYSMLVGQAEASWKIWNTD